MKGLTVPRVELCACLIGARLATTIKRESNIEFSATFFWTDSSASLGVIKNTTTRFSVFTGNHQAEIQSLSQISDWRHVPTKVNPADGLTRGRFPDTAEPDTFFVGPAFLLQPPEEWPSELDSNYESAIDPSEIRKVQHVMLTTVSPFDLTEHYLPTFNSFRHMLLAVAWLRRFVKFLEDRDNVTKSPHLTVAELRDAETNVIHV